MRSKLKAQPVVLQTECANDEKELKELFAIHPSHYRIYELLKKTAETKKRKNLKIAIEFTFDILWNLSQEVPDKYISDKFRDSFLVLKKAFAKNRLDKVCKTLSDMFLNRSVLNKTAANAVVQLMARHFDNCARFMLQPSRKEERNRVDSLMFHLYCDNDTEAARVGLLFFRELLCVVPMREEEKCFFKTERILPYFETLDVAVRLLDQKELPRACNEIGEMVYYGCMQHKKYETAKAEV